MKFVIPGGSGQIGALLARAWSRAGHEVVIVSRGAPSGAARHVAWDGRTLGEWARELDGVDVVVNLAGRSVNCRYTPENRRQMLASRVDSTRVVGEAIARCARPPRVWLQMSTATIYAHRFDAGNDEATGLIGGEEPDAPDTWRFSIDVARAWERTLDEAIVPHTRKIALRTAMVMSPDAGGVFDTLRGLVRRGLGGRAGDGRQYVSWIHERDFVRALEFLVAHEELRGAVNLASPNPLPNEQFMRALREAAGVRIGLPATRWMIELGARFMRTESELVLKSRRVVPRRLLAAGFTFEQPEWSVAARELCARKLGAEATSPTWTNDPLRAQARALRDRLDAAGFPELGGTVGNFLLYDSFLAGNLSQACDGVRIPAEKITAPDEGTCQCIAELRRKQTLTADERAFLDYFDLQEDVRALLLLHAQREQ